MSDRFDLAIYARPQRLVRINSRRRLNVLSTGTGSPTVIFAHGLGSSTLEWSGVQAKVSKFAATFAYDRAGFGFSDPGPLPRTTDHILADLRLALRCVGATPPYVLVGHSAGNYEMRLFAFRHLEEVAGMVLVDPGGDNFAERTLAITPKIMAYNNAMSAQLQIFEDWARQGKLIPGSAQYNQCIRPPDPRLPDAVNDAVRAWQLKPAAWRALRAEDRAVSKGANDRILAAARRNLNDLPLVVLTRSIFSAGDEFTAEEVEAFGRLWTVFHEEHAALSTRGMRRDVPNSGHQIHVEQPDVVVEAIREVIATGAR